MSLNKCSLGRDVCSMLDVRKYEVIKKHSSNLLSCRIIVELCCRFSVNKTNICDKNLNKMIVDFLAQFVTVNFFHIRETLLL